MSTKVYLLGCRINQSDVPIVVREMERGRRYYNAMVAALNDVVAGTWDPVKRERTGGKAKRIERLTALFCADKSRAKNVAAKAIYSLIRRASRDIRASPKFSGAASGCYKFTYDTATADFDRAVSAKRKNTWPGEPYRERRDFTNDCMVAGVRFSPPISWAEIRAGDRAICASDPALDEGRYFRIKMRVSKESDSVDISCAWHRKTRGVVRTIPDEAKIAKIAIYRTGDFATGRKFVACITATEEPPATVSASTAEPLERVGVDIGWQAQPDGAMLVAMASDGGQCVIPAYAVRMAMRVSEIQAERDALAAEARQMLPSVDGCGLPKSANATVGYIQRHNLPGFDDYLDRDTGPRGLRRTQDHVRKRYQDIRSNLYRHFAKEYGPRAWVLKTKLQEVAEGELKGEAKNYDRTIASCFELAQWMRNNGAVEVVAEREQDPRPTLENCERLAEAGRRGELLQRPARKAVRMYRKRKAS